MELLSFRDHGNDTRNQILTNMGARLRRRGRRRRRRRRRRGRRKERRKRRNSGVLI